MLSITTPHEMQQETRRLLQSDRSIAFVPTMGFLHEGHLELMRQGRRLGDVLIISIFVNPTQFGPSEDFEAYPRDMDRDLTLAESVGVDIVFAPEAGTMYERSYQTHVDEDLLPNHLCGLARPGHFRGVATVVTKTPIAVEINAEGFVVHPEKRQYPLEDLKDKRSPLQEFLQGVDRAREKQYLLLLIHPNGIGAYVQLNTHLVETYPSEDPREKGELSRIDIGVEPFSQDWTLIGTK